jgi:hypothetical protein
MLVLYQLHSVCASSPAGSRSEALLVCLPLWTELHVAYHGAQQAGLDLAGACLPQVHLMLGYSGGGRSAHTLVVLRMDREAARVKARGVPQAAACGLVIRTLDGRVHLSSCLSIPPIQVHRRWRVPCWRLLGTLGKAKVLAAPPAGMWRCVAPLCAWVPATSAMCNDCQREWSWATC